MPSTYPRFEQVGLQIYMIEWNHPEVIAHGHGVFAYEWISPDGQTHDGERLGGIIDNINVTGWILVHGIGGTYDVWGVPSIFADFQSNAASWQPVETYMSVPVCQALCAMYPAGGEIPLFIAGSWNGYYAWYGIPGQWASGTLHIPPSPAHVALYGPLDPRLDPSGRPLAPFTNPSGYIPHLFQEDKCDEIIVISDFNHLAVGEMVVGQALEFEGNVVKSKVASSFKNSGNEVTEYGIAYKMRTGVSSRKLILDFNLPPNYQSSLYTIFDGSVNLNLSSGRPAGVTGGPGQAETIISGGPGIVALTGLPYTTYPAENLTDGSSQLVTKANPISGGYYTSVYFSVDLGTSQRPDVVALINTNLREFYPIIKVAELQASDNALFNYPLLLRRSFGVNYPNMWIDLRDVSVTARYWRILILNDSPVVDFWLAGNVPPAQLIYPTDSPTFPPSRVLVVPGGLGKRTLVVPDSRKNDCYWVDLPDGFEMSHSSSLLEAITSIEMAEETPGTL